ncbi:hypothetical protein VTK73DRAFT_1350 [Phialemonium thermophilum]|uniref:Six-bladed beta-propeller-like protein n=1 Tax=Phialemonium thermophilum TaxID=223376 RepID=A0ABR3VTL8_9PEZI
MADEENAYEDVVLVDQLPSNSWVEGFTIRPNGLGLVSRLDRPELYSLDLLNPDAEPVLVHTFPNATGLVNLCQMEGRHDEYVIISGNVDLDKIDFRDFVLWHVAFIQSDGTEGADGQQNQQQQQQQQQQEAVRVTKLAEMPEAGCCIGVMPASERTLIVADNGKSCIWCVDVATGASSLLLADPTMEPASGDDAFALNRLRYGGGYVWFANTSVGTLCRFPVRTIDTTVRPRDGGDAEVQTTTLEAAGPVEVLVDDIQHCDGLVLTPDSKTAYTASYMAGLLWRIEFDETEGRWVTRVVRSRLVSPTAVELRYDEATGRPRLFVVCCGGIEVGWINEDDRKSWSDLANINQAVTVSVTVTTEIVQ